MVNRRAVGLDMVFSALADPTRRGMLARLAAGESSLSELARPFRMSLPAIHKHLRVLARAGLVAHAMREAARWISRYRRFWERQFDALARYLEDPNAPSQEDSPWPPFPK